MGCVKNGKDAPGAFCLPLLSDAGLQDLLVYSLKGVSALAHAARAAGHADPEIDTFINGALFSTLTNVNFDDERFYSYMNEATRLHARLAKDMKVGGWAGAESRMQA